MAEKTTKVSGLIRELHDEMGGAIPIASLMTRSENEDLSEEEILEALDKLEMDGIISKIDDETIEFM